MTTVTDVVHDPTVVSSGARDRAQVWDDNSKDLAQFALTPVQGPDEWLPGRGETCPGTPREALSPRHAVSTLDHPDRIPLERRDSLDRVQFTQQQIVVLERSTRATEVYPLPVHLSSSAC